MNWLAELDRVFPRDGEYIEPLSERWRQARRGRLTSSKRAQIIHNRKPHHWNKTMVEIRHELSDQYAWKEIKAKPLDWGRKNELRAIANIELATGADIIEPGLLFHPELPFVTATPDGVIDGHISVEVKCPYDPGVHLNTLYHKRIKPLYKFQVQWEAWVGGYDQILFCSFDPHQPAKTQLVMLDIPVDKGMIGLFEKHAREFADLFQKGRSLQAGEAKLLTIPANF